MSSTTRNQEYVYQYRNIAIANAFFCGNGPRMNVGIPSNLLDIKAIYLHAVLQFDVSVATSDRTIQYVGCGYYQNDINGDPVIPSPSKDLIYVNRLADPTTRIVDLKIDITYIKDRIMATIDPSDISQPTIVLDIINRIKGMGTSTGKIILWKIDFVYTTKGIQ